MSISIGAISNAWYRFRAKRQLITSISALIGSNLSSSLLSALGGLLIARFIGPEVAGLYKAYTIPLTYLTFLHLGTFDGLWRQIPFYLGKDMPDKVNALASSAGTWNLIVSLLVSSGFLLCALYSLFHHDLYGVAGWLAQGCCCWAAFYGGYLGATYRTINQFTSLARIQLIQALLNFSAVFITPFLAFYGLCLRASITPLVGVWLNHRYRPLRIPYSLDKVAFKEVVSIGLPFCLLGSLYTSVWVATESALIFALGGVTDLGFFTVAAVIREGMTVLPQSIHQVLSPRVVEKYSRTGSIKEMNSSLIKITVMVVIVMVTLILLSSITLDYLVPFAIPKYVNGIPLMKICLWFSVVQAADLPLNSLFALGNWWLYGRGILVGLLVFALGTYLLLPVIGGLESVAYGSLLGRSARTVVAYLELFILLRSKKCAAPPAAG